MGAIVHGAPTTPVGVIRKQFMTASRTFRKLQPAFEATSLGNGLRRHALSPKDWQRDLPIAKKWIEAIPPESEIDQAVAIFDRAVEERASFEEVALIVGAIVESFPSKSGTLGTLFFDALSFMIEEAEEPLSGNVLGAAYHRIVTDSTFIPSVHEFLTMCMKLRSGFEAASSRTADLRELRWSAEDVLEAAGEAKLVWHDADWPMDGYRLDRKGGG